jgi:hypothetical protein
MELKYADEIYEMSFEEVRDYHNNLVNFLSDKKATSVQAGSVRCAKKHYDDIKNGKTVDPLKTKESLIKNSETDKSVTQILDYFKGKRDDKGEPDKKYPIEEQFYALGYESFFGNEVLVSKLANKTMLYLILRKNKVDWAKNEKLNLYQDYFISQKKIVASISRLQLSRMLDCSPRTISYWLRQLEKDGLIEIERVHCDEDDDRRHKYNVYILGEVVKDGSHKFYGH